MYHVLRMCDSGDALAIELTQRSPCMVRGRPLQPLTSSRLAIAQIQAAERKRAEEEEE